MNADRSNGSFGESDALKRAFAHQRLRHHNSFWSYLNTARRSAKLYAHWMRLVTVFRRFRLVTLILRLTAFVLSVLEAGALALLSALLLLFFLPILIFLSLGILLTVLWEAPKKNREIASQIKEKQIHVLFWENESGEFFKANARSLAAQEGNAVIVISPFYLSSRGIRKRSPFYVTARMEEKDLFLVRRYYFFSLQKAVLSKEKTAYWY